MYSSVVNTDNRPVEFSVDAVDISTMVRIRLMTSREYSLLRTPFNTECQLEMFNRSYNDYANFVA